MDDAAGTVERAGGRQQRWLILAVAALPVVATMTFTWVYAVDVPFWDEWVHVSGIAHVLDGGSAADFLMHPHNEHVIVVPKAVILATALLADWDIRWEMAVSLLLLVVALAAFRDILGREGCRESWWLPLAAVALFAWHGWENLTWGMQVGPHLCLAGSLWTIALLTRRGNLWWRLPLAAIAAACAQLSFGTGYAAWATGFLILVLRPEMALGPRIVAIAAWAAAAGTSVKLGFPTVPTSTSSGVGAHLLGLATIAGGLAIGSAVALTRRSIAARTAWCAAGLVPGVFALVMDPALATFADTLLRFVAAQLGVPVVGPHHLEGETAGLVLLVLYGLAALALVIRPSLAKDRRLFAATAIGVLTLGSSAIVAAGRQHLGLGMAALPRYSTFCLPAWPAALVMVASLVTVAVPAPAIQRGLLRVVGLGGAVLAWFIVSAQLTCMYDVRRTYDFKADLARALYLGRGLTFSTLDATMLPPEWPGREAAVSQLQHHRFSVFRRPGPWCHAPVELNLEARVIADRAQAEARHAAIRVSGGIPGNSVEVRLAIVETQERDEVLGEGIFDARGHYLCRARLPAIEPVRIRLVIRTVNGRAGFRRLVKDIAIP